MTTSPEAQHAYECWAPRPGGICPQHCSCWCHGKAAEPPLGLPPSRPVDVTTTWLEVLPGLLLMHHNANDPSNRAYAEEELKRMAGLADAHIASIRNMSGVRKSLNEALEAIRQASLTWEDTSVFTSDKVEDLWDALFVAAENVATRL